MTKLLEILNVENSRQENNDFTSIHLWREGSFYRMYNLSAWLIVAYCYNENLIKEGYKPLQVTRKRIAGTDDTLCFIGFPLKSLLKFIPNAAGFQPNDDIHITIPISLQNSSYNIRKAMFIRDRFLRISSLDANLTKMNKPCCIT